MKILAINGSPKGMKSTTNLMIESFLKGAELAGAEIENVILKGKKINNCTGCFTCWTKTPGKCIFNDDANDLLLKILEVDILVFGSPLYSDNITADLKSFIDRMLPMGTPYFEKDETGEYRHGDEEIRQRRTPKFIMISNAGFPENNHFQVVSNWINRFARNTRGKVIAEIYRGQGPILSSEAEALYPIIEKYKSYLVDAGKEIVKNEVISEDLQNKLNENLIPHEIYIKNSTKMWDKKREKV